MHMSIKYITINNQLDEFDSTKRLIHPLIYKLLTIQTPNTKQIIFYITDTKYPILQNLENNEMNLLQYSIYDIRNVKYQHLFLNGTSSQCSCSLINNEENILKSYTPTCIQKAFNIKSIPTDYTENDKHLFCLFPNDLETTKFNIEKLYKMFFEGNVKKLIVITELQFKNLVLHDFFNFELKQFENTQFIFEFEHLTSANFTFLETFLKPQKVMEVEFFSEIKNETKEFKKLKDIPILLFVNNSNVITTYKNYLDVLNIKIIDNFVMKDLFEQIFIKQETKNIKSEIYTVFQEVTNKNSTLFSKEEYNVNLETKEIYKIFEDKDTIDFIENYFKKKSVYFYLKSIISNKQGIEITDELINKFLIEKEHKEEINIYKEIYKKWVKQLNCLISYLQDVEKDNIYYIRVYNPIKYNYFLNFLNFIKTTDSIPFLKKFKCSIVNIPNDKPFIEDGIVKIVCLNKQSTQTTITNLIDTDFYNKFKNLTLKEIDTTIFTPLKVIIPSLDSTYACIILNNITQLIRSFYKSNYLFIGTVKYELEVIKKPSGPKLLLNHNDKNFIPNIKKIVNIHKGEIKEGFEIQEFNIPNFLPSNLIRGIFTKLNRITSNKSSDNKSKKDAKNEISKNILIEMFKYELLTKNGLLNPLKLLKENDFYLKYLLRIFILETTFFEALEKENTEFNNGFHNLRTYVYGINNTPNIKPTTESFIKTLEISLEEFEIKYLNSYVNYLFDIPVLREYKDILNMKSLTQIYAMLKDFLIFTFKRYHNLKQFNNTDLISTTKKSLLAIINSINLVSDHPNPRTKYNTQICICNKNTINCNYENLLEFNKQNCIHKIHFNSDLIEFFINFAKQVYNRDGYEIYKKKFNIEINKFTKEDSQLTKIKEEEQVKETNKQINVLPNTIYEIDLFLILHQNEEEIKSCSDDMRNIDLTDKIIINRDDILRDIPYTQNHIHFTVFGIHKNPYQNPETKYMRHIGSLKIIGTELMPIIQYNKWYMNDIFKLNKKVSNWDSHFILIPFVGLFENQELILYRERQSIPKISYQQTLESISLIEYDIIPIFNDHLTTMTLNTVTIESLIQEIVTVRNRSTHKSSLINYLINYLHVKADTETINLIKSQSSPIDYLKEKYSIHFDSCEFKVPFLYDTILKDFCEPKFFKETCYNIIMGTHENLLNSLKTVIHYMQALQDYSDVLKFDLNTTKRNLKSKYKGSNDNVSDNILLYSMQVKEEISFRFLEFCIPVYLNNLDIRESISKFIFGIGFSDFMINVFGVNVECLLNSSILENMKSSSSLTDSQKENEKESEGIKEKESEGLKEMDNEKDQKRRKIYTKKKPSILFKKKKNTKKKRSKTERMNDGISKNTKYHSIEPLNKTEIIKSKCLIKKMQLYDLLSVAFNIQSEIITSRYHQLEFIGDTVLKYLATVNLFRTFIDSLGEFYSIKEGEDSFKTELKELGIELSKSIINEPNSKLLNPLDILVAARDHAVNNGSLMHQSKKFGLHEYVNNEQNYFLKKFSKFHINDPIINLKRKEKLIYSGNTETEKEILYALNAEAYNFLNKKFVKNGNKNQQNKQTNPKVIGSKPHADLVETILGISFLFEKSNLTFSDNLLQKLNILNPLKLKNFCESVFQWIIEEINEGLNKNKEASNEENLKAQRIAKILLKYKRPKPITSEISSELFEYKNTLEKIYFFENKIPNEIKAVEDILKYKFKNKGYLEKALIHPSAFGAFNIQNFQVFNKSMAYELLEFAGDCFLDLAVLDCLFASPKYSSYPYILSYKNCVSYKNSDTISTSDINNTMEVSDSNSKDEISVMNMSRLDLHQFKSSRVNNVTFSKILVELNLHRHVKCSLTAEEIEIETKKNVTDYLSENCTTKSSLKKFGDMFESIVGAVVLDTDFDYELCKEILKDTLEVVMDYGR